MTKTLTEQWRDGTLPEGYYYIRWSFNIDDEPSYMLDFYDRENFTNGAFINKQRKFIDEVMCVVPSYDEYKRLQEQLKEANELLYRYQNVNDYVDEYLYSPLYDTNEIKQYLEKWGVK